MQLKYITRNNTLPERKKNLFFCCHPEDFKIYFDSISTDILKILDCTVWYSDSPDRKLSEDELSCFDLFVIPVTRKLLMTPNCAIDYEFRYALSKNKAILPIVEEKDLGPLYQRKMGPLQYIDKNTIDVTARTYEQKLWNYIFSLVSDDKTVEKIRTAFDAYVFLSYRKKDRKYSNELMKLIHANEEMRDVAIWYDEFLVPGENFNDTIKKAIEKCSVFTLAVTPQILEKDNYVIKEEYPLARKLGKPIVPVEMCPTDKQSLGAVFAESSISADAKAVYSALCSNFSGVALRRNNSPEHDFFIGLAYLEGIDVEIDTDRAVKLITSAANAGVFAAIEKLCFMYASGHGVKRDERQMIYWQKKLVEAKGRICQESPTEENYISYMEEARSLLAVYEFMEMIRERMELIQAVFSIAQKAYSLYTTNLTIGRNFAGILGEYGSVFLGIDNYTEAVRHYDIAKTVLSSALSCSGIEMTEKGIECRENDVNFEMTVAMSDYCQLLCGLADSHYFSSRDTGDVKVINEAAKIYQMIYAYLENKLLKNKFDAFEKYLSVVYSRLCDVYQSRGDYKTSREWGLKAVNLDEDRFNRLMQNGDVLVAEDYADSCFAYAWIDREDPDLSYLEKALKWYKYLADNIPQRPVLREKADEVGEMCRQIREMKRQEEERKKGAQKPFTSAEMSAVMQDPDIYGALQEIWKAKALEAEQQQSKQQEKQPERQPEKPAQKPQENPEYSKLYPETPKTRAYHDSMMADREARKRAVKNTLGPMIKDLEKIHEEKPKSSSSAASKSKATQNNQKTKEQLKREQEEARKKAEEKKNFEEVYKKAQEGDPDAMERLADRYLQGIYVEKNMDEFLHWMKKASSYGNGSATYKLSRYYRIIEKNQKEALRLEKIAGKQGEWSACRELSKYYIDKYGFFGLIPSLYWKAMKKRRRRW